MSLTFDIVIHHIIPHLSCEDAINFAIALKDLRLIKHIICIAVTPTRSCQEYFDELGKVPSIRPRGDTTTELLRARALNMGAAAMLIKSPTTRQFDLIALTKYVMGRVPRTQFAIFSRRALGIYNKTDDDIKENVQALSTQLTKSEFDALCKNYDIETESVKQERTLAFNRRMGYVL